MYAYSNDGMTLRAIEPDMAAENEIVFDELATEAELLAVFPNREIVLRQARQVSLVKALEQMYDKKAQERNYDNRYTCALRAGYNGPFYEEAVTFAQWMDECNVKAYAIMNDVLSGKRSEPTEKELLADMPELVWPS